MLINNLQERVDSSLNTSTTKQAYSFGKALRFKKNTKIDFTYNFYNLPTFQSKRGTSLGYGKKGEYDKNMGCGSNQLYAAPSYFGPKNHSSPAFSFGTEKRTKKGKEITPGPKYISHSPFDKDIPSIIFGKEGLNMKRFRKNLSFIGPGAYYNEKNHEISRSATSNLANSANLIIGKEKRFRIVFKDTTPGPGRYNIPSLINETGIINDSKYISSPARSFIGSKSNRFSTKKDLSPGPGQYNFFSIFEGYSRERRTNENDKIYKNINIT